MKENMEHICLTFKNTKESFLNALRKLAKCDADFSGENGDDYLWGVAKNSGFETNVDYVINKVKDIGDFQECADKFIELWMKNDNYYREYDVEVINRRNTPIAISLAFTWSC